MTSVEARLVYVCCVVLCCVVLCCVVLCCVVLSSKRAHLRVWALQTPPQFNERTPQEREERKKIVAGKGKKRETLGHPLYGAPLLRPPLFLGLGPHPERRLPVAALA